MKLSFVPYCHTMRYKHGIVFPILLHTSSSQTAVTTTLHAKRRYDRPPSVHLHTKDLDEVSAEVERLEDTIKFQGAYLATAARANPQPLALRRFLSFFSRQSPASVSVTPGSRTWGQSTRSTPQKETE
eukprot:9483517-Pyramimonas_sp.AAC.2